MSFPFPHRIQVFSISKVHGIGNFIIFSFKGPVCRVLEYRVYSKFSITYAFFLNIVWIYYFNLILKNVKVIIKIRQSHRSIEVRIPAQERTAKDTRSSVAPLNKNLSLASPKSPSSYTIRPGDCFLLRLHLHCAFSDTVSSTWSVPPPSSKTLCTFQGPLQK